jgi:hypothetical protein
MTGTPSTSRKKQTDHVLIRRTFRVLAAGRNKELWIERLCREDATNAPEVNDKMQQLLPLKEAARAYARARFGNWAFLRALQPR